MPTAADFQRWQSERAARGEDPNDAAAWTQHANQVHGSAFVDGGSGAPTSGRPAGGGPSPISGYGYIPGMISDAQFADRLQLDRDRYGNIDLPYSQAQIRWGDQGQTRADTGLYGYSTRGDLNDIIAKTFQDPRAFQGRAGYLASAMAAGLSQQDANNLYEAVQQWHDRTGQWPSQEQVTGLAQSTGIGRTPTLGGQQLDETKRQWDQGLAFDKEKYGTQLATNPRDFMASLYWGSSDRGGGGQDAFAAAQDPSRPQTYQEKVAQVQASPVYRAVTEQGGVMPAFGTPGTTGGRRLGPGIEPGGVYQEYRAGAGSPAPGAGVTPFQAAQRPGEPMPGGRDTRGAGASTAVIGPGRSIDITKWRSLAPTQREQFRSMASASGQDPQDWEEEMRRAAPQSGGASATTGYRSRY